MPQPRPFTIPRLLGDDAERLPARATRALAEEWQHIAADGLLSDRGKREAFAKAAAPHYRQLRGERDALEKRARQLEQQHEAVTGKAYSVTAQGAQREMLMELFREARRDPAIQRQLNDRLLDENRRDADTMELRRFAMAMDPLLTGLSEAHRTVIRHRLEPTLPAEVERIRHQALALDREMGDVESALRAITASVVREDFEALGVVGKPMLDWTAEERQQYAERVGMDRYRADLEADVAFAREPGGPVPAAHAPNADERLTLEQLATKDAALREIFTDATADT